jgi:uncharacterized Zn finger protein (UPF0148 family)
MEDSFITKKLKYNTLKKTIKSDSSMINHGTIDSVHTKIMDDFEKQKKNIPKMQQKINFYKNELNNILKKDPSDYKLSDINKKSELKDKIELLEDQILTISSGNEEMDYFITNLEYLKEYYGSDKNINSLKNKENNNINFIGQNVTNDNLLNKEKVFNLVDFFEKKTKVQKINENGNIFEDYIKCTLNKTIKKKNALTQICPDCGIEKILQSSDGNLVCIECGHTDQLVVDMEKINFKDPFYENKSTKYKRMNHFSELLNQFQAKESSEIPPNIFNSIINEIKKQKITNPLSLNKKKMRSILKKLELNKFFEHIPFIINKITGLPPPTLNRETEERLKSMFKEIQLPFELFRPKNRKNFINYNYIFHKFFQLLEYDHFLPHFSLLKSPSKLREQDELWEKICKYLKWEFIPST